MNQQKKHSFTHFVAQGPASGANIPAVSQQLLPFIEPENSITKSLDGLFLAK
jgi:hypothetical protein